MKLENITIVSPSRLWTPSEMVETHFWWDASDTDTITLETGTDKVEQVDGKGNYALSDELVQLTSADRPINALSAINGLNTINFDEQTLRSSFLPWSQTGNMLHFAVFRINEVPDSTSRPMFGFSGPPVGATHVTGTVTAGSTSYFRGLNGLSVTAGSKLWTDQDNGGPSVYSWQYLYNDKLTTRVDGTTVREDSITFQYDIDSFPTSLIRIGTNQPRSFFINNMDFGEMIIIDSDDDELRLRVEGYLAHKWKLQDNLPDDHPYKNLPPRV
jgi:hypothetical protein